MARRRGVPSRVWARAAGLKPIYPRARGIGRESAVKPGSVVDSHSSGMRVAAQLKRPTRKPMRATCCGRRRRSLPYLVLLQVGFAVPPGVAAGAVRSYRTISPLPAPLARRLGGIFLLHFPWTRVPQALPGTVPCGARTFLHPPACAETSSGCLADSQRAPYACLSSSARL